ncbi:class B sortase [Mediterraneibacter glycyrrhizinilyticus]|jgi:SrtB family sortase|uniref:class B sortase n=1 Tax=Mediterraneibacter glycyrrhizinilyticus TaxID=342942 RepID=UPI000B38844D|nr:class B sortase [Mediterraneibacter glycyrrhizinilyticus]MCF2567697.1 class B sortase [Mediterraneibacter glycyrrhizinilyticus]OUO30529.1 SrtB family sortase [Lachnoclostridium sp. An298]
METQEEKKSGAGRKRRRAHSRRKGHRRDVKRERTAAVRTEEKNGKKKKQKRAAFDVLSGTILIVAVCVFVFSLYQLAIMLIPYHTGGQEYEEIQNLAVTADEDGSGFSVDFDALLEINPDTIAWIRFDEPSIINYPVVKSADNNEYLTKTFAENDNKLGAIFMDMRNSSDFSDRNTIIYGHHLNVSPEMFSRLHLYEDEEFCREHPNFYIYTPDGSVRTYTVFSAGIVNAAANNYDVEFASDEEFEQYIELCRESSNYQVDVEVNAQSQILSLSTCTGDQRDERFLLQGVLTAVD